MTMMITMMMINSYGYGLKPTGTQPVPKQS